MVGVQVANRCCGGRIVSVLEGGYRIQGLIVSAFSRSVAAHLRALAEPNHQVFPALCPLLLHAITVTGGTFFLKREACSMM